MSYLRSVVVMVLAMLMGLPVGGVLRAAAGPLTVSPGGLSKAEAVGNRCPTFSWALREGALGYELAVLMPLDWEDHTVAPLVLHRRLPAGTSTWTPSLSDCLEPGARYQWHVRAVVADQGSKRAGPWSDGRRFEVPVASSLVARDLVPGTPGGHLRPSGLPGHRPPTGRSPAPDRGTLTHVSPARVAATDVAITGVGSATEVSIGVVGQTASSDGGSTGVVGEATAASGTTTGVHGQVASASGVAGDFLNTAGGMVLLGRTVGQTVFSVDGTGGLYAMGTVTAAQLAGGGTAVTGVDAASLQGVAASGFVAVGGDTMIGDLSLSGATTDLVLGGAIKRGTSLFLHSEGTDNAALGFEALDALTTGVRNTALGRRALTSNTQGRDNTGVGEKALQANLSGKYNTAVGSGALASSTDDENTAIGRLAMSNMTSGERNTAIGAVALQAATGGARITAVGFRAFERGLGGRNTAIGSYALRSGVGGMGVLNTAVGLESLEDNTDGGSNTAVGAGSLSSGTLGNRNVGLGTQALASITTGNDNIAIGDYAGYGLTLADSDNIMIGNTGGSGDDGIIRIGNATDHDKTFIAGITGVTTAGAATAVMIDGAGQLGTVSSSRRFKHEIEALGEVTERLLELRPVSFRYLARGGAGPPEYGLIAEEVAEVWPELVVLDADGQPLTVRYHLLSTLLVGKLQEQEHELDGLRRRLASLERLLGRGPGPER